MQKIMNFYCIFIKNPAILTYGGTPNTYNYMKKPLQAYYRLDAIVFIYLAINIFLYNAQKSVNFRSHHLIV